MSRKITLALVTIFLLNLFLNNRDAFASGFNDDADVGTAGIYGARERTPRHCRIKMTRPAEAAVPLDIEMEEAIYGEYKRGFGLVGYAEGSGFIVHAKTSIAHKVNQGTDPSTREESAERSQFLETPHSSVYSASRKSWPVLKGSEIIGSSIENSYEYSDCIAVKGEEKRFKISLSAGDYYKDGKYIYGIHRNQAGQVVLLLGNPSVLKKEDQKLSPDQKVLKSIVGEEVLDVQRMWDEVTLEQKNGLRVSRRYGIGSAEKECVQNQEFNQNWGCSHFDSAKTKNYKDINGIVVERDISTGFSGGFCPGCTFGQKPPAPPPGTANPGKR